MERWPKMNDLSTNDLDRLDKWADELLGMGMPKDIRGTAEWRIGVTVLDRIHQTGYWCKQLIQKRKRILRSRAGHLL